MLEKNFNSLRNLKIEIEKEQKRLSTQATKIYNRLYTTNG